MIYLKIRHMFKSCNIYLKSERFRKSKFTLSKVFDLRFTKSLTLIYKNLQVLNTDYNF